MNPKTAETLVALIASLPHAPSCGSLFSDRAPCDCARGKALELARKAGA